MGDSASEAMSNREVREGCRKRGLSDKGRAFEVRKRLARHEERVRLLMCPVCREVPPLGDLVLVCAEGHHLCFGCLLGVMRCRPARRRCPMRCALQPRPPGRLCRELLRHEYAELPACAQAPGSPHLPLYRMLRAEELVPFDRAGEAGEPLFAERPLAAFALMVGDEDMLRALRALAAAVDAKNRAERELAASRGAVTDLLERKRAAEAAGSDTTSSYSSSSSDEDDSDE